MFRKLSIVCFFVFPLCVTQVLANAFSENISEAEKRFLQARKREVADPSAAIAEYSALLSEPFPIPDALHAALGRLSPPAEAIAHWKAVAGVEPLSPFIVEALERLADDAQANGRGKEAEKYLSRLFKVANDEEVEVRALVRLMRLQQSTGDNRKAMATAEKIWVDYAHMPESDAAEEVLAKGNSDPFRPVSGERIFTRGKNLFEKGRRDKAVATLEKLKSRLIPGSKIEPELNLVLGKAHYFMRQYEQALAPLDIAARDKKIKSIAGFYHGRSLFGLSRGDEGAREFVGLAKKLPNSSLASTFLYQAFKVFEGRELWSEARNARELLLEKYPDSSLASDVIWQAGREDFLNENFSYAAELFEKSANGEPKGWERARGLYWQGRALLAGGLKAEAEEVLHALIDEYPLGYYALLSKSLLADGKPDLKLPDIRVGGPVDAGAFKLNAGELPTGAEAERIIACIRLQLPEAARFLLKRSGGSGVEWARLFFLAEDYKGAIKASGRSWLDWPPDKDPSPSDEVGLSFPPAYSEIVYKLCAEIGIHPHLVLAIGHTESNFEAKAYSNFAARGIMQFIPSTGAQVAKAAGIEDVEPEDLFEPELALKLGAVHLRELLDKFDGNAVAAIAAYNGGGAAVSRWLKKWGRSDIDLFVEMIQYRETRRYVKKTITALDAYSRLLPPGVWAAATK